ncbi:unnamed protein product [Leuciscus chuanchicus]
MYSLPLAGKQDLLGVIACCAIPLHGLDTCAINSVPPALLMPSPECMPGWVSPLDWLGAPCAWFPRWATPTCVFHVTERKGTSPFPPQGTRVTYVTETFPFVPLPQPLYRWNGLEFSLGSSVRLPASSFYAHVIGWSYAMQIPQTHGISIAIGSFSRTRRIDMYSEGTIDLMELITMSFLTPPENKQKSLSNIEQKAKERFLPVYEKGLANSHFLVGNQLSRADVHLLEASLMLQELYPTILSTFPKIQAFQEKMKALPRISKFLQPGSARKPPPDEALIKTAKEVLSHVFK